MNKRIIYPQETGIAVITPSGELSLEATALKDVPTGVKYKIIDVSDYHQIVILEMLGNSTLLQTLTELVRDYNKHE